MMSHSQGVRIVSRKLIFDEVIIRFFTRQFVLKKYHSFYNEVDLFMI